MNPSRLHIRPARPDDKKTILRFTEHTWEFGDYIADVWDFWLNEPDGKLLVLTLQKQPVALIHVVLVAPGEAWLEGLRVNPACRRTGLATQLTRYCLKTAVSLGVNVLRFITSSLNTPVHQIAAGLGFNKAAEIQTFAAPPVVRTGTDLSLATLQDIPYLNTFLEDSIVLKAMGGLNSTGWRFHNLNLLQLEKRIQDGMVRIIRHNSGLGAMAITEIRHYDETLVVNFFDGLPESLERMALDLRREAGNLNLKEVSVRIPPLPQIRSIFQSAGYGPSEDHPFWIFEKFL